MADSPFHLHLANLEAEYSRLAAENIGLREQLCRASGVCNKDFVPHDVETISEVPALQQEHFHRAVPVEKVHAQESTDRQATQESIDTRRTEHNKRRPEKSQWLSVGRAAMTYMGSGDAENEEPGGRLFAFADAEEMKARLRSNLMKKPYKVSDYYKKTGCARHVAMHPIFDISTLVVILANAIWIAIETDYNDAELLTDADLGFQIVENAFCAYFTLEICVRLAAFEKKCNSLLDKWFVFDSFLVTLMIIETWVMSLFFMFSDTKSSGGVDLGSASIIRIARLLRLLRMARISRLVRAMPELMILIKGMVAAVRSVVFTLVLLVTLLYVFGIAFTQSLHATDAGELYFPNVPASMNTLWLYATLFDGVTKLTHALEKEGLLVVALLDVFILIASLTVMNMLIGVLCEVVSAVASSEKEELNFGYVRAKVMQIYENIDTDHNGMISRDEFAEILESRDAARAISDLGVDVVELVDMVDLIFRSEDGEPAAEIPVHGFMDAVLQFQGKNTATVKDIVQLRQFMREEFKSMNCHSVSLRQAALSGISMGPMHNFKSHPADIPHVAVEDVENGSEP